MFIKEQMALYRELREEFIDDAAMEAHVWSPVSCRWCCWSYRPNPYGKRLFGF